GERPCQHRAQDFRIVRPQHCPWGSAWKMSWASDKAREMLGEWGDLPNDPIQRLVERAIRETIARCSDIATDGKEYCGCAAAIRKLGEPSVTAAHEVGQPV